MMTNIDAASDLLMQNNQPFLANALLAREVQINQNSLNSIFKLGLSYLKGGNFESAQICFYALKKNKNNFENHFYYAQACESLFQFEEAKNSYLDALLLPTFNQFFLFEAYKNVGNLYLKDKNLDTAEDFYHKAYTLNPESPQLLVNLGTLEMQKFDASRAIERFRQALQIDPKFSSAWVGMSLCYHNFGEFNLAWGSILKAYEGDASNGTALLLLSQWSIKANKIDFALECLMNFFDSGLLDTQLSLAFIELCVHAQRLELARTEIERSLLWEPRQPELLHWDQLLKNHGI